MNGPKFSSGRPQVPFRNTLLRMTGLAFGLSLLGACQTAKTSRTAPQFETAFASTGSAGNQPLVFVPNSGAIESVEETRSSASLRQRIVYGQSRGRVDLTIASGRVWDDPAMAKPSRAGIAAELGSLEDGSSYRIVRQPMRNAYGPIGVAVSQRCAYAWQWIDDLQRVELGRAALRGPVAVSLRVQHCGRRPMAAETLLADLTRIRLGVSTEAVARATRPRIVRPRPAAKPLAAEPVATLAPVAPAIAAPTPVPGPPSVAVNSSRTLVTLPPAPAGQSYLAQPAPAPAAQTVSVVPRPTVSGGSDRARFLTDALPASGRTPPPAGW